MDFNSRSPYPPTLFYPPPLLPFAPRPFPQPSSPPFPSGPFPSTLPFFSLGPEPEGQAGTPDRNAYGFGDADSRDHRGPSRGPPPIQPYQWYYDQKRYEQQQQQNRQPPPTHSPRMVDPRYEWDPRFDTAYAQSYPLEQAPYDPFAYQPRSTPESRQYNEPGAFLSAAEPQSYEYRETTGYLRPPNHRFTSWHPSETSQWETHARQPVYSPHDPWHSPKVPGPERNEDRPRDRRSQLKSDKPCREDALTVLNLLTRMGTLYPRKRGIRRAQTWPPQRTNRDIPRASPRAPPMLSENPSREPQSRAQEEKEKDDEEEDDEKDKDEDKDKDKDRDENEDDENENEDEDGNGDEEQDEDEDYDLDDESWWGEAKFEKRDRNKKGKNVKKRRNFYMGMPEELMRELHLRPKGKSWVNDKNWMGHRNGDRNFKKGARGRDDVGYTSKNRCRYGRARWDKKRCGYSRGGGREGGNKGKNRAVTPNGARCPNPRCPGEGQRMDEDLLGVSFCGFCPRGLSDSSSSFSSSAQGPSDREGENRERAVQFSEVMIRAIEAVTRLLIQHGDLVHVMEDEGVPEERDDRGR